jgi:hypothetical protein
MPPLTLVSALPTTPNLFLYNNCDAEGIALIKGVTAYAKEQVKHGWLEKVLLALSFLLMLKDHEVDLILVGAACVMFPLFASSDPDDCEAKTAAHAMELASYTGSKRNLEQIWHLGWMQRCFYGYAGPAPTDAVALASDLVSQAVTVASENSLPGSM